MSIVRARSILAGKSQSAGIILLALLLEVSDLPSWAAGRDREGRAIRLVGRYQLEQREDTGAEFVRVVLEALQAGEVPNGVHVVSYAPKASEFIATIWSGKYKEVLGRGPRESGKSMAVPGALAGLAEAHDAGGFPLPLRVGLVSDTLLSFSMKLGRSVEEPMWGGVFSVRNDRREAVLALGGTEYILADAVGAGDESASERLKTRWHVVEVEELVPSGDTQGIPEDKYVLALSSLSLPTPWPGMIATSNAGSRTHWWIRRFKTPGLLGCTYITVPASDRLSSERLAELKRAFQHNPEMYQRLIEDQDVDLPRGAPVAEHFDPSVHVAPSVLYPNPSLLLAVGIDGGFTPSVVVGQLDNGQVRIFAGLTLSRGGMLELLEQQLIPWLQSFAPWALSSGGAQLVSLLDPNLRTPSQISIWESPEQLIQQRLGGRVSLGPTRWPPRREAILKACGPHHVAGRTPLQISKSEDTELLIRAFGGEWYYPVGSDGQIDRSGPRKPNSPAADLGDAACYLLSWLYSGETMEIAPPREIKVEGIFSPDYQPTEWRAPW